MLNRIRLPICLSCLFMTSALFAQERHLYTLTLHHALPEQVLPTLQAQLSSESSLSNYGQQLILNATATEYRQTSALLEQLDRAQRSLLISVRSQQQLSEQNRDFALNGDAGDGAVQVRTGGNGQWGSHTQTRVFVNHGMQQGSRDGVQQVRAVEGMAAFINNGGSYSLRSGPYGQRELTPVTSGFYATARLLDNDEVVVDIDQHDQRLARGGIDTQSLRTQVRGRLGEWITLGAIDNSRAEASRDLNASSARNTAALTGIAIRIDKAP